MGWIRNLFTFTVVFLPLIFEQFGYDETEIKPREGWKTTEKVSRNFRLISNVYLEDLPRNRMKAVIIFSHGFHYHSLNWDVVAKHFVDLGYGVYRMDHQGLGQSDGDKGYVERFYDYADDVITLGETLKNHFKLDQTNTPLFLVGHELGASSALIAMHMRPFLFAGCVAISPYYPGKIKDGFIAQLLRLLSYYGPKLPLMPYRDWNPRAIPHDQYAFTGWIKARTLEQIWVSPTLLNAIKGKIVKPVLVIRSQNDGQNAADMLEAWTSKKAIPDMEFKQVPGISNAAVFNVESELMQYVLQWLQARSPYLDPAVNGD